MAISFEPRQVRNIYITANAANEHRLYWGLIFCLSLLALFLHFGSYRPIFFGLFTYLGPIHRILFIAQIRHHLRFITLHHLLWRLHPTISTIRHRFYSLLWSLLRLLSLKIILDQLSNLIWLLCLSFFIFRYHCPSKWRVSHLRLR